MHLCGPEARKNGQLFSAAQSREQAAILFKLAKNIILMSPELAAMVGIRDTAKQLYCDTYGTVYRALSAEASTAYGLSPVLVVHDELGQVVGPRSELYDALETAAGAQEAPLSIIISTQAPTDADLLSVLIDDAKTKADPRVKLFLYTADESLDPFAEETIKLANPAYGDFLNTEEVLSQAASAKRMPTSEAAYRNLVLNQRVNTVTPFVPKSVWLENGAEPAPFDGLDVFIGLDLSSVSDLTAMVAVARDAGTYHVRPTFWLPEEGLADKSLADREPYDRWAHDGLLETTPGRAIEYEWVAQRIREVFDTCNVRALCFDRWGMRHLRPWLKKAGFTDDDFDGEQKRFIDFGQGFQSMSPALRELESILLSARMRHGNHPVLTMCARNVRVQSSPAGDRKFTKEKSTGRIDGMVALAMAVSAAASAPEADYVSGSLVLM